MYSTIFSLTALSNKESFLKQASVQATISLYAVVDCELEYFNQELGVIKRYFTSSTRQSSLSITPRLYLGSFPSKGINNSFQGTGTSNAALGEKIPFAITIPGQFLQKICALSLPQNSQELKAICLTSSDETLTTMIGPLAFSGASPFSFSSHKERSLSLAQI